MQRIVRRSETPLVFWLCLAILTAAGSTSHLLDLQSGNAQIQALAASRTHLYSLFQASYYLLALWLLAVLTPRWVNRLRPAVLIDHDAFARHARRILGTHARALFALLPPAITIFWLLALGERLISSATVEALRLDWLTYISLPVMSVLFSALAIWRMVNLMRLAREPLAITLFDVSATTPLVHMSSAYSALIIGGELLHQFLLGSPNGNAILLVPGLATLSSLTALLLPQWAVHRRMRRLKNKLLLAINQSLGQQTQGFVGEERPDLSAQAGVVMALSNVRTMIGAQPTWPMASVAATIRSLFVAVLPVLYVLAQQLVVPYLKAWLATMGVLAS